MNALVARQSADAASDQYAADLRDCIDRKCADPDRINRLQVSLLRQSRNEDAPAPIPLLKSMNSISAALGWTG